MEVSQCVRPGCSRKTKNKKYCSQDCYRNRNTPISRIEHVDTFDKIPQDVVKYMRGKLGSGATTILQEMSRLELESPTPTLSSMSGGKTWGDWNIGIKYDGKDYRPREALSYDKIDWMNEIGICNFILLMKLAPAAAPMRDENGWAIDSPDKELVEITTAVMKRILPRFAIDFGRASMENGHAIFEQVYGRMNKYQLGLSNSRSSASEFTVPLLPKSINPRRLRHIDRNKDTGEFQGFTIDDPRYPQGLSLTRRDALIITYNEQFRNLYGHSFYESMYPLAAMYEVAMRAMMRYIDRMATPVVVGEGPFDIKVSVPVNGGMEEMSGMEAALLAAVQASISNAIVIPSNVDPETKEKLFKVGYMEATGGLQVFIDALEHVSQDMFRAGMAADRALTQSSGGVGSYNIGEVHQNFTLVHSDMILTQWVWALNQFWLPYISEYNRGVNGPPISLNVQLLDPRRRESFANMVNAGRDHPAFKELGYWINWEHFAQTNNVPLRSKKDRDAIIEEIKKRNEEMMAEGGFGQLVGQDQSANGKAGAEAKKENPAKKTADDSAKVTNSVLNGNAPIFLSDQEWAKLKDKVVIRK